MTSVGIFGARGKMGQELCKTVETSNKAKLSCIYEIPQHPELGKTFHNLVLTSDLSSLLKLSDVIVDFTSPMGTLELLKANKNFKKPLIIGSTGLNEEQVNEIKNSSKIFPIVFSPNYSIGINLLFKVLETVGNVLSKEREYDLEIIELHHRYKKDSPSGTALKLAEVAAKASGRDLIKNGVYGRKGNIGERKIDEVGIMALRLGDVVGEHTVIFSNLGERIELGHKAHSRQTFSNGAVEAALWIVNKKDGLYTMKDVLGF